MADRPINPDREQQRRDNIVSRRQSGLEPRPEDLKETEATKAADREDNESEDANEDRR